MTQTVLMLTDLMPQSGIVSLYLKGKLKIILTDKLKRVC